MGARLRPQWVWKAGHQAKRFTFETSELVEFSLLGWGYFWDPSSFLIFIFLPFWHGSVYPMPVPLLYFGST